MKCLQKAKELEPDNTTIQKEIQDINTIFKKQKNYEKELAKRMFNRSGGKNEKSKSTKHKDKVYC